MATPSLLFPSTAGGGATSLAAHGRDGRLRYAEAKDLPSFPSVGIKNNGAAASAAASLGWANRKTFEHWKPDTSASASAAAVLAKDYKMAALWEPRQSDAGFKAAALAAGSAQRHAEPKPQPAPGWGNSAASMAFKSSAGGNAPAVSHDASFSGLARHGSMQAAKGAMAGMRARSSSTPQAIEDSCLDKSNASSDARNAATAAHRPSTRASGVFDEAGAVPFTTMSRQMFTSNPPVRLNVEDKKRADILHASAVAMAKRMYIQQQKMIDSTKKVGGRSSSFTRHGSGSTDHLEEEEEPPMQFNNLQEAAYRLAQERLAKLHDEHQKNREFQEYYGSSAALRRGKFGTIQKKLTRRRSASDSRVLEDLKESQRIRRQMSLFNNKLSDVDEKKRARDRAAVLAAARRNVTAQLQGMDQKLYHEMGRITPGVLSSWEQKAYAVALLRVDSARDQNAGKVNIGGGKFMDEKAVNDIAAKRIQPLLDEINEKAEVERERQAVIKLDEERRKEEAEKKRLREKEVQEIHRKLKDEQKEKDKIRKEELKKEEKARKEQLKIASAEERQNSGEATESADAAEPMKKALAVAFPKLRSKLKEREKSKPTGPAPPEDAIPTPSAKVKTWIKHHFGRPRAKSLGAAMDDGKAEKGFVGGAALAKTKDGNNSTPSVDKHSASMRAVALAGTSEPAGDEVGEPSEPALPTGPVEGPEDSESDGARSLVQSISTASEEDDFSEAKSQLRLPFSPLSPPPAARTGEQRQDGSAKGSPKGSRFVEMIE